MNENDNSAKDWLSNADMLTEALPYMQKYADSIIVIKYGGHAMKDTKSIKSFCEDIALLKQSGLKPVIVHGGGPQIGNMLEKLGIETKFESGMRITDDKTLEIVEMVLCGGINKEIASNINNCGCKAVGLSGKDASMIIAKKHDGKIKDESNIEKIVDLGFVGIPEKINTDIIEILTSNDFIPVIAPLGISEDGKTFNINADTVAGAIAHSLNAKRLLVLTDVEGVKDNQNNVIEELTKDEALKLIADETIAGGMIPKINTCIDAVEKGVSAAVIVDGRVKHAVLLELFTEHGAGTLIR
ncbi:MAG: acetylglutamate kinase [Rhodobiaceae bacterium]|jgi:acetylglutamate kinase|nr:acetylglutamate kinase [Rhodobiaceae bacterium]MDP6879136.1 acetylglutamate kinase [Candidatus Neomarinimicrobiota bacterium]MED5273174.1 acetylglutamate kinase [Pseudomonadota bacterium]MED5484881.1 acetylglutamate kinase [Pseudomonadota bacterium]|tara:strand:- start:2678 stop:3574 length:897 start_codon:yes stop_codon:yes gene_type:complete